MNIREKADALLMHMVENNYIEATYAIPRRDLMNEMEWDEETFDQVEHYLITTGRVSGFLGGWDAGTFLTAEGVSHYEKLMDAQKDSIRLGISQLIGMLQMQQSDGQEDRDKLAEAIAKLSEAVQNIPANKKSLLSELNELLTFTTLAPQAVVFIKNLISMFGG